MSAGTLFEAIAAGDRDSVQRLLDEQPELISSHNSDGLSPLVVALYRSQRDIAQDLLARLRPEQLSIHEAAAAGVMPRLEQLVAADPASVNAWSPDGFQPLGLAAFFGHPAAVELLLAHGGEVNTVARHPFGVNALHAALAGPTPDIARALIAAGADVNAPQRSGATPLQETAFSGNLELARLLLAHGADPAAVDDQGRAALDLARERGHSALVELLSGSTANT
jgi:ankyrin repeat protein